MRKLKRSKLGVILDEKGLSYKDFAEIVYLKTGYLIHKENICNYATGWKDIKTIKVATYLAQALDLDVNDII